ncbi:hypothetical protein [Acutalibacter intestini]|uniref:hypothetical protein n=1 Tax=Acutalibacter intestini TaxID=3093659 RepID=UPI002AC9265E|nr:hypothetical protein [Acutalibacter sp. M00204]
MNIAEQIARITTDKNTIRAKATELGLAQSTANLDQLAAAIEGIENQGAVSATVQEGDTYTIPKGYHNGSGTVSGVAGGGNYSLQSKSVTPTKLQQNVTPDSGYYGLSDVTVAPIPEVYQNVSAVTAGPGDVLTGKVLVDSTGKVAAGTMPNHGAAAKTLTAETPSFAIPEGYHNGQGLVKLVPENKSAVPAKAAQVVQATEGKVLGTVTVESIPKEYADTADATALAGHILAERTAYAGGEKLTGTMPDNGDATASLDGLTVTSVVIPAGYTRGGTVSLTDDIAKALAAV